jgi:hypothetical protein
VDIERCCVFLPPEDAVHISTPMVLSGRANADDYKRKKMLSGVGIDEESLLHIKRLI